MPRSFSLLPFTQRGLPTRSRSRKALGSQSALARRDYGGGCSGRRIAESQWNVGAEIWVIFLTPGKVGWDSRETNAKEKSVNKHVTRERSEARQCLRRRHPDGAFGWMLMRPRWPIRVPRTAGAPRMTLEVWCLFVVDAFVDLIFSPARLLER